MIEHKLKQISRKKVFELCFNHLIYLLNDFTVVHSLFYLLFPALRIKKKSVRRKPKHLSLCFLLTCRVCTHSQMFYSPVCLWFHVPFIFHCFHISSKFRVCCSVAKLFLVVARWSLILLHFLFRSFWYYQMFRCSNRYLGIFAPLMI